MGVLAFLRSLSKRLPLQPAHGDLTPREDLLRAAHYSEWPLTRFAGISSLRLAHEFIRHEIENLGYRNVVSKPPHVEVNTAEGTLYVSGEVGGERGFRQTYAIMLAGIALIVAGIIVAPFWGPAFFIGPALGIPTLVVDRIVSRGNRVTATVQYVGTRPLATLSVPAALAVLGIAIPNRSDVATMPHVYDGRPVPVELKLMLAVDAKREWLKELVLSSASQLGEAVPEALARVSRQDVVTEAPDRPGQMPMLVAGSLRQYETRFPLARGSGGPVGR